MWVKLLAGVGILLIVSGCSSQRELVDQQRDEIRELKAEIELLRADLETARRNPGSESMQSRIDELERELAMALQREQDLRGNMRGTTIEVLQADIYFESGSAELTEEGKRRLGEVAQRMQQEYPDRTFRIEGFTDDRPIGARLQQRFPDNWDLSAARAASVVRHLQWVREMDPTRFEIVGYGEHNPIDDNGSAEGRRQNRRVRVAVLP